MPDKVIAGITNEDLLKLMEETHEKLHENEKKENEFTVQDWGTINGISYNLARRELDRLEEQKVVQRRNFGRRVFWSFANENS